MNNEQLAEQLAAKQQSLKIVHGAEKSTLKSATCLRFTRFRVVKSNDRVDRGSQRDYRAKERLFVPFTVHCYH